MHTAAHFFEMKRKGEKIAMLTAYDAPTARMQAEAGIDVILIGDSVGTNVLGYASEQDVKLSDITHHVRAVRRGAPDTFLIGDMPYATYPDVATGLATARTIMEAGANMVKFEGARTDLVAAIVAAKIPLCCHIGLEPQNHEEKRLKGKTAADAKKLIADAQAIDAAGMNMVVLELIPAEVAAAITKILKAPTIGIGAGPDCDGQVLVMTDVLAYTGASFRHNKRFAEVGPAMKTAFSTYVSEVHGGQFPTHAHAFHMKEDELRMMREG